MRYIYKIKNNKLDSVELEKSDDYTYFMFKKDNNLIVNRNNLDERITKNKILIDLSALKRHKDNGLFKEINGITAKFLNDLNKLGITVEEIKEVMNESSSKREHNNLRPKQTIRAENTTIIVGA